MRKANELSNSTENFECFFNHYKKDLHTQRHLVLDYRF